MVPFSVVVALLELVVRLRVLEVLLIEDLVLLLEVSVPLLLVVEVASAEGSAST